MGGSGRSNAASSSSPCVPEGGDEWCWLLAIFGQHAHCPSVLNESDARS
jgi:hypothetical protein